MFVSLSIMLFKLNDEYAGEYIVSSIEWLPFLNALSNLVLIKPYRKQCIKSFTEFCKKSTVTSITSVETS